MELLEFNYVKSYYKFSTEIHSAMESYIHLVYMEHEIIPARVSHCFIFLAWLNLYVYLVVKLRKFIFPWIIFSAWNDLRYEPLVCGYKKLYILNFSIGL